MEKPLPTPAEKVLSQRETNELLDRLSRIPFDVSRPILFTLNYRQLMALCSGANKTKNKNLMRLSFPCQDPNFWQDWLFQQGYDLPETLPNLLHVLREEYETDADLLKSLFFENPIPRYKLQTRLFNLLRHYYRGDKPYEDISMEDLHQAILDWDYIKQQIQMKFWREWKKIPYIFTITITVPGPALPATIFTHPRRISMEGFLQDLVEKDFSGDNLYLDTADFSLDFLNGKPLPAQVWKDFASEINEQSLALLPSFVREGDLIRLTYRRRDGVSFSPFDTYYYVDSTGLIKLNNRETDFYFPEEAQDFLIDHDVVDYKSVFEFYPKLLRYDIIGYTQNKVPHQFPGRKYRGY